MSRLNGYPGMSSRNSLEKAFEDALSGRSDFDGPAPAVVELVETLRAERDLLGAPRGADAHILAAASAVLDADASAPRATRTRRKASSLRRRVVVLAASLGLAMATAGIGLADDALPDEALFGLDMALERMGIGDGGASERAAEVLELLNQGKTGLALAHASATVATTPQSEHEGAAQQALEAVAQRFSAEDSPVPEGVADLIATLVTSAGAGDGETIAEVARAIRDSIDVGTPPGPPVDVPPGPPSPPAPPFVTIPAPVPAPGD
ncbi:MAG: hypothetical protein R3258_02255 [Acidimicrobiia bacterium]|nr:hypothetical protein [Acidimicrobiia bacterium]